MGHVGPAAGAEADGLPSVVELARRVDYLHVLASRLASGLRADLLILLTDMDSLYARAHEDADAPMPAAPTPTASLPPTGATSRGRGRSVALIGRQLEVLGVQGIQRSLQAKQGVFVPALDELRAHHLGRVHGGDIQTIQ